MATTSELFTLRDTILNHLDNDAKLQYLQLLRLFFRGASADEFNKLACRLLTTTPLIRLHDQFIDMIRAHVGLPKNTLVPVNETITHSEFTIPEFNTNHLESPRDFSRQSIANRILFVALQSNVSGVGDNIPEIILKAMELFVKNIITATVTSHNGFKVLNGVVPYHIGHCVANPWITNANSAKGGSSVGQLSRKDCRIYAEQSVFTSACSTQSTLKKVTLQHLYWTLKSNKTLFKNKLLYYTYLEQMSLAFS